MTGKAKAYISFVVVVGATILANEMYLWESQDVLRYLCYLVLATLSSRLKVTLPGHVILLVRYGIYIIENLYLEELARDQRYEFTFICLPLKLRGATGSPVRPIAVVPH